MSIDGRVAELSGLLGRHQAGDALEHDAIRAIHMVLAGALPFSRNRFDPGHVTASAFVLHPSRPDVALILHTKIGRWLQPGGHVESDDTSIMAAALREVSEEVGVAPAGEPWLCDVDVHVFPARGTAPAHLHHDIRFAFRSVSDRLVVGQGANDARWWPLDALLAMEESLARPARKLVGLLGGG
jgi:8-oxo-dGTP pyrophosphatase MutT (NUDIX family)